MRNVPLQIMQAVHWLRTVCPDGELFSDSREIGPDTGNAVFFAYEGDSADGRNYISNAIENGAVAVIYESEDRKSTRLNSSHRSLSRMPSSA